MEALLDYNARIEDLFHPINAPKPYNIMRLAYPVAVVSLLKRAHIYGIDVKYLPTEAQFREEVASLWDQITKQYPLFLRIGSGYFKELMDGQPFSIYRSYAFTMAYNFALRKISSPYRLGLHAIVLGSLQISNLYKLRGGVPEADIIRDVATSCGFNLTLESYRGLEKGSSPQQGNSSAHWFILHEILKSLRKRNPGNEDISQPYSLLIFPAINRGKIGIPKDILLTSFRFADIDECAEKNVLWKPLDQPIECIDLVPLIREKDRQRVP